MADDADSSVELRLLHRAKAGDAAALDQLLELCLPPLERWARGRLPRWARDLADTQDIVQDAVIKAVRNLSTFEPHGAHAWRYYLRAAVKNRILDEIRRMRSRPTAEPLDHDFPGQLRSPVEEAMAAETIERYEQALACLPPQARELVIARLEWEMSHAEIAAQMGKPSADAARMAACRAVLELAAIMRNLAKARQP